MRATAGAALIREGRVLLGRRSPHLTYSPDVWDVFGGHCEPGEAIETTLHRELKEELDVVPTDLELLAVLDEPDPGRHGPARHALFVVRAWAGEPAARGDEHSEIRWFEAADLESLELASPAYVTLLGRLLRQR